MSQATSRSDASSSRNSKKISYKIYYKLLREVLFSRPWSRLAILGCSLLATVGGLAGPLFQKTFVDLLTDASIRVDSQMSFQIPWMKYFIFNDSILSLVLFSFLSLFLSLAFSQLANYLGARESIFMQKKLAQRLYDKALSLRSDSLQGRPVGEIVAVYATDVPGATVFLEQSVPTGANIVFPLIAAPLVIGALFEIPLTPTILMMVAIGTLNFFMAYRQSKYFFQFKRLAADRIGLVNEWVQNIRALRILGWVSEFEKKIFQTREVETENRIAMVTNGQAMNSVASSITYVLNIVVLSTMIYFTSQKITTGSLFALLWIVGVFLTRSFRQMPWLFTFIFDSWTSLTRVSDFLQLENFTNETSPARSSEFQKIQELSKDEPALLVKNLNLKINQTNILKSIDFNVKKGEFIAIVGEVGSGKSMLLLSLMGETGASFGDYRIDGNNAQTLPLHQLRQFFTFVPQEGFIMSSSLRDNVAFEYDTPHDNDERILQCLERAQFKLNLERLEAGLNTEIGERGVNLSGGQKQRVSLARVDFNLAPLILMDDCLSALDVETEELLIESLLKGSMQNRTRILVTHRLTVLDQVDRVLYIENGKLLAQGPFTELLKTNERFRAFTATVAKENVTERPTSATDSSDQKIDLVLTESEASSPTSQNPERLDS